MTYEAQFAETVFLRGHNGDQIDAYLARPIGGNAGYAHAAVFERQGGRDWFGKYLHL